MTMYAFALPDRCQHVYVCLMALKPVNAAHDHVQPTSNVARLIAIVAPLPSNQAAQGLGKYYVCREIRSLLVMSGMRIKSPCRDIGVRRRALYRDLKPLLATC